MPPREAGPSLRSPGLSLVWGPDRGAESPQPRTLGGPRRGLDPDFPPECAGRGPSSTAGHRPLPSLTGRESGGEQGRCGHSRSPGRGPCLTHVQEGGPSLPGTPSHACRAPPATRACKPRSTCHGKCHLHSALWAREGRHLMVQAPAAPVPPETSSIVRHVRSRVTREGTVWGCSGVPSPPPPPFSCCILEAIGRPGGPVIHEGGWAGGAAPAHEGDW